MSESKHTPGPWQYHRGADYTVILGPDDTTERPLAEIYSGKIADSRLIAAAPDMLAALKETASWMRNGDFETRGVLIEMDRLASVMEAAIAKAESPSRSIPSE